MLTSYLKMLLNFRYGLEVLVTRSVAEGCSTAQKHAGDIACSFVIQDAEVDSKKGLNTLSQQGRIPLLLLSPNRFRHTSKPLCERLSNVTFGSWEKAFSGTATSVRKMVETTFAANNIDTLFNGEEHLSPRDLQKKVKRRIKHLHTLPTLPELILRIMKLMEDPHATIDDLESVISTDASMVWKLLEVIKAPAFAGTRRTEWTMREIIVRLGMRKVGAIAQQIKFMNSFVGIEESTFDIWRFWEHSLGCAMIADRLYARKLIPTKEKIEFHHYWIGALLHDIGKLVLGVFFSRHFTKVLVQMTDNRQVVQEFHRAEADLNHAGLHEDVARLMLIKADVDPRLVGAVSAHHLGGEPPEELACLLHMADNLSKDLGLGYLVKEQGEYNPSVLKKLGLTMEDVRNIKLSLGHAMVEEIKDVVHKSTTQRQDKIGRRPELLLGIEEEKTATDLEPVVAPAPAVDPEKDKFALFFELLDQIEERLQENPALTRDQQEDFLVDVNNIRVQITKNVPNKDVVFALLDEFAIAGFCGDLIDEIEIVLSEDFSLELKR